MDLKRSENIQEINDWERFESVELSRSEKNMTMHESVVILEERDADTEDENDCEVKENIEGVNGTHRTITLQTLMSANVLQPGKSLMTIDYLGQKFVGDLMPDGKIKSHETETVFLTPSAWAMHCKRIINPEKKSGCGWASVKYKGKKLDAYKNSWLRKCALQKDIDVDDLELDIDKKPDYLAPIIKRILCSYNHVVNRNHPHDGNMLIKAVSFSSVGKLQPFLITFHSSALLLADFHCHLTTKEVCGYFGGHWDTNTHTLKVTKAYPCRCSRFDYQKSADEEQKIRSIILEDQLFLVGWYHSHPKFQAEPSLRDCDVQLEYQTRMRGLSDITYTPCISIIISPYYDGNPTMESVIKSIWVMPPIETKQVLEYGRPMLMQYSVVLDKEVPEYIRCEIQACGEYYKPFQNEFINFNSIFREDITFIEKLKRTLHSKFPVNVNHTILWNWICEVLGCAKEDDFISPKDLEMVKGNNNKTSETAQYLNESMEGENTSDSRDCFKIEKNDFEKKVNEIKVMSLQEQLCLPSGLNMNPVRTFVPLATPNISENGSNDKLKTTICSTAINTTASTTNSDTKTPGSIPTKIDFDITVTSSDRPVTEITLRDSPIILPPSAASPSKVPIKNPLSPPKSEKSLRSQNALDPSLINTKNITPTHSSINKPDVAKASVLQSAVFPSTTNDLVAASLAQLTGQLAPNFVQTDISSLFQQHFLEKGYTNSNVDNFPSEKSDEQKNSFNEAVISGYSTDINLPHIQESSLQAQGKQKTELSRLCSNVTFSSSASKFYKTKLIKELDSIRNDPLKINELMRSPEYATLLLHQAEALGATTLGTLGLGSDLNLLSGINFCSKANSSQASEYTNLVEASKILGYESCLQQGKTDDFNVFLQKQMGAVAAAALVNASLSSSLGISKKQKQSESQTGYSSVLQSYSKLFETGGSFREGVAEGKTSNNSHHELTTLLSTGVDAESSMFDPKSKSKDVYSRVQQNENQNNVQNSLYYQQHKTSSDLSALFAASSTANNLAMVNKFVSTNANLGNVTPITDSEMYSNAFSQDKSQDSSYLQQHGKLDNNFFISPAVIMKIHKDSLSAMMMRPPKPSSSTVSSLSRSREASTSPSLAPTISGSKSPNACSSANLKYNYNAIDLAVSSIQPRTSIPLPLEAVNNSVSLRRPSNTPPVDLSSLYNERQSPPLIGCMKKRMEFSSIAELVAPPPAKCSKVNEDLLPNIN